MAEISKIQPFGSSTQYDLTDSNAPRKDGTGATGTWGISITGNAATTTKLATARNIALTGAVTGNANFDGSENISITTTTNHSHSSKDLTDIAFTWSSSYSDGDWMLIHNGETGTNGGQLFRAINKTNTAKWIQSGASGTWEISITGSSASCTGNAATATRATYTNYLSNASHSITITTSSWGASNPWGCSNRTLVWGQQGKLASASSDSADLVLYYGTHSGAGGAGWFMSIDGGVNSLAGIYTAVWNDFAEYRVSNDNEPGRVIAPASDGKNYYTTKRLQPASRIISDTFGQSVGYCDEARTPIGVAGRVLAYTYQDCNKYKIGDAVCAAPNGTVDKMKWWEKILHPDRILGIVNEIPQYEEWIRNVSDEDDNGNLIPDKKKTLRTPVKGRIWIDIK